MDGSRFFLSKLQLPFHHQLEARTCLTCLFPKTSHVNAVRRTCTGRRSFAAAITFWARVVIHSTWRCHSGGVVDVALGGGASNALRKEEYVTSMDFRIFRSAGRRSVVERMDSEWMEKMPVSPYLPRRPVDTVGVHRLLQGRVSSP